MQSKLQEIIQLSQRLKDLRIELWLDNTLFTLNWWILLVTTLGVLIAWLFIVDKGRLIELIIYGLMVTITSIMLDVLGVSLLLWQYPHTLIPSPILSVVHIIQMPIIYMTIYQYFDTWKVFLIATTINAFVFSFILEPLLVWLQIYELYQWKHIYSFLPYIAIAVLYKAVINRCKKWDKHYSHGQE